MRMKRFCQRPMKPAGIHLTRRWGRLRRITPGLSPLDGKLLFGRVFKRRARGRVRGHETRTKATRAKGIILLRLLTFLRVLSFRQMPGRKGKRRGLDLGTLGSLRRPCVWRAGRAPKKIPGKDCKTPLRLMVMKGRGPTAAFWFPPP